MSAIKWLIDFILHIDTHLAQLFIQYWLWIYWIIFVLIFIETWVVIMPFLPWDSLLFAAWALAWNPANWVNIHILWIIAFMAAILWDTANYEIGKYLWPKVFTGKYKWIKKEYLERTHEFYEKHWGKTIIYARFIPIIRTFAPFVAWVGKMTYKKFISFNIIGWFTWSLLFVYGWYFFWSIPTIQKNFSIVIILIIFVSICPMIYEWIKHKIEGKKK